jgi:F-type H+-transporting ATPase subunit epsilon
MATVLRLRVYTPERTLRRHADVREVTAQGALGQIGVLPDHAALVTALDPGMLSYRENGSVVQLQLGAASPRCVTT